jgi:hypothetical protein
MDVVTYGADARQFFDVHARMGESMLRSERIVARSSANIVTGLFQAQNSAEALANAFLNLEHATKLGLGVAIGVSVGVALFEALKKAREEAYALNEEIRNVIASASGPASYSSLDALSTKLTQIREEQKKVQAEANHTFASLAAAIAAHPTLTPAAAVAAQDAERTARSADLRAAELETLSKMTQKMAETADLEDTRLHLSQQTAAVHKLDAEYQERYAALLTGPGQNLDAIEQLDRLHALQVENLNRQFELENKKTIEQIKQARIGSDRLESLREEVRYTADIYRNTAGRSVEESLSAQLDYEKALRDLKEETLQKEKSLVTAIKQARTEQQSLVLEQAQQDIRTPAAKFADLRENQRLYEALRSRAWQQGMAAPAPPRFGEEYRPFEGTFAQRAAGIQALIGADFSSLAALSGLDFSGLETLSQLNIIIQ